MKGRMLGWRRGSTVVCDDDEDVPALVGNLSRSVHKSEVHHTPRSRDAYKSIVNGNNGHCLMTSEGSRLP